MKFIKTFEELDGANLNQINAEFNRATDKYEKYKQYFPKSFNDELTRPIKDLISNIDPASNEIEELVELVKKMNGIIEVTEWKEVMRKVAKFRNVVDLINHLKGYYIYYLEKRVGMSRIIHNSKF